MERKNITIGIDVEPHIKKKIASVTAQWKDAPIKWHPVDGLHVVLAHIGWVNEDDLSTILAAVTDVAQQTVMFDVRFTRIAATHKNPHITDPAQYNIVRLEGDVSESLRILHARLHDALHITIKPKKHFRPYVTIGQMRVTQWQLAEQRPIIDLPVDLVMDVVQISVLDHVEHNGVWTFAPYDCVSLI